MHVVNIAAGMTILLSLAYLAMGALVLWVSPRSPINRALASFGILFGAQGILAMILLTHVDRVVAYNVALLRMAMIAATVASYLLFVGRAAETPLVKLLRARFAPHVLGTGVLALSVALYLRPDLVAPTWAQNAAGDWDVAGPATLTSTLLNLANAAAFLFALVAFVSAYRRAPPGTVAKRRAGALALAFGIQDGVLVLTVVLALLVYAIAPAAYPTYDFWFNGVILIPIVLAALVILARGVLKYQLFDFDLRLKATLARATLAAVFFVVFFVVEQVAQVFLSAELGYVAGGLAAGLLVFALRPLERLTRRVADTAMPRTTLDEDYLIARKLDVYRAALEAAREAGALTDKDRANLDRLRAKLELPESAVAGLDAA